MRIAKTLLEKSGLGIAIHLLVISLQISKQERLRLWSYSTFDNNDREYKLLQEHLRELKKCPSESMNLCEIQKERIEKFLL